MDYEIGDAVVHWTHGLGTVIAIEEMHLAGETKLYYVVEIQPLMLWVPVEEANKGSIRLPTESMQFKVLIDILRKPGEELPDNRFQRKITLSMRMQQRTLEDLCHVIRDLSDRSHQYALNQDDSAVLFRAEENLLDEWVFALGTKRSDALREMETLLQGDKYD